MPATLISRSILSTLFALFFSCKTVHSDGGNSSLKGLSRLKNADERHQFIQTARVWVKPKQAIGSQDLSQMPASCQTFKPTDIVTCSFVPPKRDGGGAGWTPKFSCIDKQNKIMKIKYGRSSAEVFHETFAARFLQALGFPADCDYPIKKLICEHCPKDPSEYSKQFRISREDPKEEMATRGFDAVMIEEPFGETFITAEVENNEIEGWGFNEVLASDLKAKDPEQQTAREALTLLMALIQHTDNRRDNQSLYCKIKAKSLSDCPEDQRYLVVGDLGSTLGAFKIAKASGDGGVDVPPSLSYFFWDNAPIWKNWAGAGSSDCTVQVIAFDTILPASLTTQKISEKSRKFLADLLSQLSDRQLKQLVEFAKLGERTPEENVSKEVWDSIIKMQAWAAPLKVIPFSPINNKAVGNDKWVSTLRKKIDKILENPCRSAADN